MKTHLSFILNIIAAMFFGFGTRADAGSPVWKSGSGEWEDMAHWGGALPGPQDTASIEGNVQTALSHGDVMLNQLDVGSFHDAHVTMTMNGGSFTLSKLLRIGEITGSAGQFIQNAGDLRALEICIGAANTGAGGDRHAKGDFEIRGGSLLVRHLTLGWGEGSTARLRIVGSKARPLAVLDYLWIGIRQKGSTGSRVDLDYVIDEDGVTPIVMWNKTTSAISLVDDGTQSTCGLNVTLKDAPPSGDIALMKLPKPCRGIFTGLPEGSPVRVEHGKLTYEWTLTYRGGPEKTDIVLTDARTLAADGSRTPYTAGKVAKAFVLSREEVDAGLHEIIRREEALLKPVDQTAQRAFPGAEGFGAYAKGGRGGRAILVTNLNDTGPGSLREAVEAKGPRTVIFRVGGVIPLKSALSIREPYLTIAGQTAPGDGICIRADNSTHADGLVLNQTHDVVLRFLRVQLGLGAIEPKYDDGGDCISAYDSTNFIIDHCSTHWGTDETLSATGAVDLYTVQWCVIAEALNYNKHSMSSILCGSRCTWHHNLFAHSGSRNPLFAGQTRCDFRNNVLYNWGHTSGQGNFTQLNYIGNFLRPGPSTVQKPLIFVAAESVAPPASMHLAGNVMDGSSEITRDNWLAAPFERSCEARDAFAMLPVSAESAERAFDHVLKDAGALLPKRDAADARVVSDVQNRTGKIIASQQEVGGWPNYKETTDVRLDSDSDGIPDEWENAHGLGAKDAGDAGKVTEDGYTNLEHYLNGLVAIP